MVLVAIFLFALVAVAGLVADGGLVFAQRRDLQNVADAAAAAGAMQLDERAYRASSGGTVALDASAAQAAATAYLAREGASQLRGQGRPLARRGRCVALRAHRLPGRLRHPQRRDQRPCGVRAAPRRVRGESVAMRTPQLPVLGVLVLALAAAMLGVGCRSAEVTPAAVSDGHRDATDGTRRSAQSATPARSSEKEVEPRTSRTGTPTPRRC